MATEILPATEEMGGLYLGDENDGRSRKFSTVFDVRGFADPEIETAKVEPDVLDAYFILIDKARRMGSDVLVHCRAGVERSPLVVAWYLVRRGLQPDLQSAYAYIQKRRPQVQNRIHWVPWDNQDPEAVL